MPSSHIGKKDGNADSIGFVEKYALQYYTSTLLYAVYAAFNYYT